MSPKLSQNNKKLNLGALARSLVASSSTANVLQLDAIVAKNVAVSAVIIPKIMKNRSNKLNSRLRRGIPTLSRTKSFTVHHLPLDLLSQTRPVKVELQATANPSIEKAATAKSPVASKPIVSVSSTECNALRLVNALAARTVRALLNCL